MREQRCESEGAPNLQALCAVKQRASLPAIRDSPEPTFTVIPAPSSHGPSLLVTGSWVPPARLPVQGAQAGEAQTQHSSSPCFGTGPLSSWMCRIRTNLKSGMGTNSKGHCTTRFVPGTSPHRRSPLSVFRMSMLHIFSWILSVNILSVEKPTSPWLHGCSASSSIQGPRTTFPRDKGLCKAMGTRAVQPPAWAEVCKQRCRHTLLLLHCLLHMVFKAADAQSTGPSSSRFYPQ